MGGDTASVILILTDGALSDEASADNQVLWQNICLKLDIYVKWYKFEVFLRGKWSQKAYFQEWPWCFGYRSTYIVHVLSIFYLGTPPIKSINALLYIRMKINGLIFSMY